MTQSLRRLGHARYRPPAMKVPIPEMSVSTHPLMRRIPDEQLDNSHPFFKQMEQVFGIR